MIKTLTILLTTTTLANADIIELDYNALFEGHGGYFWQGDIQIPESALSGPITMQFTFNTSAPGNTLSQPSPGVNEFTGTYASADVELANHGPLHVPNWTSDIKWANDGTLLSGIINTNTVYVISFNNWMQTGTCPGEPCGTFSNGVGTVTDLALAVPGPLAGGGIYGLYMLILLALRSRNAKWLARMLNDTEGDGYTGPLNMNRAAFLFGLKKWSNK